MLPFYQQIAINVGLSWPHFSWPTLRYYVPALVQTSECIQVQYF